MGNVFNDVIKDGINKNSDFFVRNIGMVILYFIFVTDRARS